MRQTVAVDPMPQPWELYERHAELWTQIRLPGLTLERNWLARFCDHLQPGDRILDVGCGHGQPIGAQLLEDGFDVWGIDRARSPIETARRKLPKGNWHVADMASFDLGLTFGGIVMWHSLFHLTAVDQRRVFGLLSAHAQPGCVVLFTSGDAAGSRNGSFGGETLTHHSLDPADYADLLAEAKFEVLDYRERDPDCGDATVWLAQAC